MKNYLLLLLVCLAAFSCKKSYNTTAFIIEKKDTTFINKIDTPKTVTRTTLQGDTINFTCNQNIEYPEQSSGNITFYLTATGATTGNKVSIVAVVTPGATLNIACLQQGIAINQNKFLTASSFLLSIDITYMGYFNGDHLYKFESTP
jgi:hypothetical protein